MEEVFRNEPENIVEGKTKKKYKIKKRGLVILGFLFILIGIYITNFIGNEKIIEKVYMKDNVIHITSDTNLIGFNIDTLGMELPETKDDGYLDVQFEIKYEEEYVKVPGQIRIQGTSTAGWPKRNWTLKFFSDESRKKEIKLKIGNSIPSDKWIAKADWIDPSMLRNGVSYNLWKEIMDSRDDKFIEVETSSIRNEGAYGYPNHYSAVTKINEEYYGISNLLLGHDPDNFNIDKKNPKHMFLEFDSRSPYNFHDELHGWENFVSTHVSHHIDGYYPKDEKMSNEQLKSIDDFGEFINSDLENFTKYFENRLDKRNLIDMLLYIEFLHDWDAISFDIQMVTYDLKKWYLLPWDKDTTFGLNADMSGILDNSTETLSVLVNEKETVYNRPWHRTYHLFTKDVEARYKDLRDKDVFSVNNIKKLADNIINKIPEQIWYEEYLRWEEFDRPKSDGIDKNQMISWTEKRLEMLDKHFNYK